MPGIFSRLSGSPKLTLAERHRMLIAAIDLHRSGKTPPEVEAELHGQGAGTDDARKISDEALAKVEAQLLRDVTLPPSASTAINYYFLLGVTPRATTEQIRRAYRRKAKEVHPDQHNTDFSTEAWDRLMTLISDAQKVLTDPASRRAYDIIWMERSHDVARRNRAEGDLRGDWETRYRWEIAELSELEDTISLLLEEIASPPASSPREVLAAALERAIEFYESELLEIRSQTHVLPQKYLEFGKVVRTEMQRKDHLVRELRRVHLGLVTPDAPPMAPLLGDAARVLEDVRLGQHEFDIADFRSLR